VAQIVWTAEASRWLQEIYDYIAADNEEAAHRTVLAIHERAEILPSRRSVTATESGPTSESSSTATTGSRTSLPPSEMSRSSAYSTVRSISAAT
jgi:hypothetical protein